MKNIYAVLPYHHHFLIQDPERVQEGLSNYNNKNISAIMVTIFIFISQVFIHFVHRRSYLFNLTQQ